MRRIANEDGLAYTATSETSVAAFEDLVTANFGLREDVGGQLKAILTDDPEMPMAQCTSGYFAKVFGGRKMAERAVKSSNRLDALIETQGATDRERRHAAALRAWCAGDLDRTAAEWERILLDHPHDGLAIRLAHYAHFYAGDGRRMRDSIARVLPHHERSHRNYGYILGCYAFGLEESGDYAQAEKHGRDASAINPADAWSVHAVAHVLEMQERHADGIAWVNELEPHWSTVGNFRFHLYWHRCLYHFERGEFDIVLDLYDRQVSSDISAGFYLDIVNAASLLWRLELAGVDVGSRWLALADLACDHLEDSDLVFVTLHYLMVMAAVGDEDAQERMIAHLARWADETSTQSAVCRAAGLAVAEAIREICHGHFAKAAHRLAAVRYDIDRIGGSMAQRDVFEMMMVDAAEKSGEPAFSTAMLADRVANRPNSAWGWRKLATAYRANDRGELAARAAERAASLQV